MFFLLEEAEIPITSKQLKVETRNSELKLEMPGTTFVQIMKAINHVIQISYPKN